MAGMAAEHSGWTAYSVVFTVAAISLLVPIFLELVVRLIFRRGRHSAAGSARMTSERQIQRIDPAHPLNSRYFNAARAGAVITLPLLLLFPILESPNGGGMFGTLAILGLCVGCGSALVYANRKGDLLWLSDRLSESECTREEGPRR